MSILKKLLNILFKINYSFFRTTDISKLVAKRKLNLYKKSNVRFKLKYFIQMNLLYAVEEEKEIKDNQRLKKVAISTKIKFKKYKVDNNVYLLLRLMKASADFDDRLENSIDKLASLFGEIKEIANRSKYYEVKIVIKEHKETLLIHKDMTVEKIAKEHKLKINKFITISLRDTPGILIAAASGSGKSFYLMYLLVQMLKETNSIFVIDGKYREIKKASEQMGIKTVAHNLEQSIKFIEEVEKLINFRNSQESRDNETVFLVIDEYLFFLDKIMNEYGDKKVKEIEKKLINIVLAGRSADVILVLVLQRLGAAKSKDEVGLHLRMRDNIATKIGLGNLSKENFEMLFGQTKDSKIITKGRQEGYLKTEGIALQSFRVDDIELAEDFKI
jgi:hypothetical protein